MFKKPLFWIALFFSLSLALNIGQFIRQKESIETDTLSFKKSEKKYPLLAKRILQEFPADVLINFLELRSQLKEEVGAYNGTFAVYFEYLPTGTSIGVNEKNEFPAASLLKVPVAMAYLHQKERLGQENDMIVTIQKDQVDKQFGTLWKKGVGAKVNLGEAVELVLKESDNTAHKVLANAIDTEDFAAVYQGLDIDLKEDDGFVILTAKHFGSVLKALYFSSVLTKDSSQKILLLMTQTIITDKLPAGVPKGIPVAHKIGVFESDMYMDCGIVFVPKRPYLLCMISRSDEETARLRMQQLSKMVYNYTANY